MKVKNIVFSGFAAAVLMGVAADASAATQVATKAYVDRLNKDPVGTDGSYIKTVVQEEGFVTAAPTPFDRTITANSTDSNAPTSKAVYDYVTANDANTTYTAGSHITITGENNSIAVNDVTSAGGDIDANDTGLTTGNAVYEYVTGAVAEMQYSGDDAYITVDDDTNEIELTNIANESNGIADGSTALTTANAVYDYVTQLTGGVLPDGCDTGKCSLVKLNGALQWVDLTEPTE